MHQRGCQTGASVARRPPIRTKRALNVAVRDANSNDGYKGNQRGVKRTYADDEAAWEASLWGCSVKTPSNEDGIQKVLKSSEPAPQESPCRDPLQSAGRTVGQQLGSKLFISGSSFCEAYRNTELDGAEEAEIRAEILDGVRQLLRDESEVDCLVRLCTLLKEKNVALMERAIHRRGVSECAELLEETLKLEASGGMLTNDGRRRTPGGVFLRLLQDRIPREDKRFIWDEQNREQRRIKRQRLRRRRTTTETEMWPHISNRDAGVQSTPTKGEAVPVCEEREPGELDYSEVHAFD